MKIAGLLLVVICCSLTGITLSARLSRRVAELEGAIGLAAALAGDLRYTLAPMVDVMARLARQADAPPFIRCCAGLCARAVPFPQAWKRALEQTATTLESDDLRPLFHLGAVLGSTDLDGALKELEYARFVLEKRHGEAVEKKRKLGGLYRTLGLLAGVGIVVVLL